MKENGQLKCEVDDEVMQGATLEITYDLKITNISEIDYEDESFYKYGEPSPNAEEVTLKASEVLDYLDNDLASSSGEEREIITEDGEKTELKEEGKLSNKNLIDKTEATLKAQSDTKLSQGKNETIQVTVTKLLGSISKNEELTFKNVAEIIKIEKSFGSTIVTTPGNLENADSKQREELDDDVAETVTITPPTGLKTDYIAYTILAISSLGILVLGIILIKKLTIK